ncbi:eukaryotic translation initiation factor 4E [Aspergillus homomorphus CBS 101889]|uniref:Translation initiation factor eIF4e n=1 Tax=Aspergillus homomorphus (strain CBS 101889) TaxID=1450537 RepID=A0A395HIP6_ASPHC|nr:translation initiation factor eIF4e [Aspergillus homomorphus CBS 101889]RAL07640.1 translation initiation factor eIF4e [Aspergillus homomorphus CBS 101889]
MPISMTNNQPASPPEDIDKTQAKAQSNPTSPSSATTRKSLHQNIFGKLRPLPFQYHWAVWYDKHNSDTSKENTTRDYDSRLYLLHEDVSDIATFYRVYNNYPWDKVRLRDTVHIFRKGVRPVWEDPENRNGGCWRFRVPKNKAQEFFHEIAILCMANEFQAVLEKEHDHVLGVSTSARFNSNLISVWNKLGDNERSIKALEQTILDRLSPDLRPTGTGSTAYFYKRHAENDGFTEAVEKASTVT